MTDYTIGADKGFQCTFWCWVLSDISVMFRYEDNGGS